MIGLKRSNRTILALALLAGAAAGAGGLHAADGGLETVKRIAGDLVDPPEGPTGEGLLRIEEDGRTITVEPWVSMEPTGSRVVKKIAYGRTSTVIVAQTPTGTYSSDAMLSPHVRYPGISVERPTKPRFGAMRYWDDGRWRLGVGGGAGSFLVLHLRDGGTVLITDEGRCVATPTLLTCV